MSDVGKVGGGRPREDFSMAEVEGMKSQASTAAAMSTVRKDAHYSDLDVAIRGDDAVFEHQLRELRGHRTTLDNVDLGVGAAHASLELVAMAGEGAEYAAGTASIASLPFVATLALYAGLSDLATKTKNGHIANATAVKNEMHVAMLSVIDLPARFKEEEMARFTVSGKSFASGASKMVATLASADHKPQLAILQLHADQGMNAARSMVEGNTTDAKSYLASQPGLVERYDADPAFKAGFDAVVWARKQGGDAYKELVNGLEARDARYEQHHIQYRA